MSFTFLQLKAIKSRGENLIVSASAGSGKTTVMIERVLSLIDEGESLENMVICTFTRSAASDMREKLLSRLMERSEKGDRNAEKQLLLLPAAEISTLHSWCQRLIRTYFYAVDADPSFEIADEAESSAMLYAAVDEAVEQAITKGDADFIEFYDVMLSRRSDEPLKNLIKKVFDFVEAQSDPDKWLEEYSKSGLNDMSLADAVVSEERARLKTRFTKLVENLRQRSLKAGFTRNEAVLKAFSDFLKGEGSEIKRAYGKVDEKFVALNEEYRKLKDDYFDAANNLDKYDELPYPENPPVFTDILLSLVKECRRIYSENKRKKARLDYSDLEHFACRIVEDPAIKREICEKYKYIFVDEYQDVNPLQERIIDAVKGKGNLFLVGDVKQSIYAFRMCDPGIFLDKYVNYSEKGFACPIELNDNFRSSENILAFANEVFSSLMTEEFGRIDYRGKALLKSGRDLKGGEVKLNLIKTEDKIFPYKGVYSVLDAENVSDYGKADAETDLIVTDIAEKLAEGTVPLPEGGSRPVYPSDIAVLVASRGEYFRLLYEKLRKIGVNVSLSDSVKFSSVYEVKVLTAFMRYLCNFTDDISLVSLLRSPIVSITDDELCAIKLAGDKNESSFSVLCRSYARRKNDAAAEKLKRFFALADRYLALSYTRTAAELIGMLTAEKEWFAYALSSDAPEEKADALNAFLQHLTSSPYGGSVREYVAFLDLKLDDFKRSGAANAVSVMTVHGSKGLEFPFVYLAGTDRKFNMTDLSGKVIIDGTLGLCMKNHDLTERAVKANKLTFAATLKQKRGLLEEEMRLLYVALTRAKNGLYIYACVKENDPVFGFDSESTPDFEGGNSFFDWLRPSYARNGYTLKNQDEIRVDYDADEKLIVSASPDARLVDSIKKYTEFQYPFSHKEVKSSVTAMNRLVDETDYTHYIGGGESDDRALSKGNAYHKAMECIDFNADFSSEWQRLCDNYGIEEFADKQKLYDAYEKIKPMLGKNYYREKQFVLNLNGMLVQGVIDIMITDGENCTVIDYKTSNPSTIVSGGYDLQLAVYRLAAENILGLKVTKTLIYSFVLSDFIEIPRERTDSAIKKFFEKRDG